MLDVFNTAKKQGCDIQQFYGPSGAGASNTSCSYTWVKPRGVSHVYMMLIGAGGAGNATNGGGSGAVTVWYGSAQNVPDILLVVPACGSAAAASPSTQIRMYGGTNSITLLQANSAIGNNGGTSTTANQFANSGFYQSVAGQGGSASVNTASATTFLSGGSGPSTNTANYGYVVANNGNGFFQLQPIIVSTGGSNGNTAANGRGGIGSGAGYAGNGSPSGQGFVLIASW
jgi:hypothetical protein